MLALAYQTGRSLPPRNILAGVFCLAASLVPAAGVTIPVWEADFETGTGNNAWTRTGSVTTDGSGRWGRGNPNATDYQLGSAYQGSNYYVTGVANPSGNEGSGDLDSGNTIITSPSVAIPASASLSFAWYLGYDSRNSPANEFLSVSVVAGATTEVFRQEAVASTTNSPAWGTQVVDLSAYAGQSVQFRVEASSSSGSFFEAGVDAFLVEQALPEICGEVRYDIDGDGDLLNTAVEDRGLSGVRVDLFADDGGGNPTGASLWADTTDGDGEFCLVPPGPGDYVVVSAALPDGVSTADTDGGNLDQILVTFAATDVSGLVFLDTTNAPGLAETIATYFLPYEEAEILAALSTLNGAAVEPITSYNSISVAYDGTIILYDHWEDNGTGGYEVFRNDPAQPYTEVWGDGNLLNGVAPGYPTDVLQAGDVILLNSVFDTATAGSAVHFDGRDKISTSKYVAITRAAWADGTRTLLAGAWEVFPTVLWGTNFTLPVGEDLADAVDHQMFEYTGASVIAAFDNTEIRLNGTLVANLDEGETFTWQGGLNVGDEVVASRPVQLQILTGDVNGVYGSRWYTIPPTVQFSNSYVSPVSTPAGDGTRVWLYNGNAASIDVLVEVPGQADATIPIAAGQVTSYNAPNGEASRFSSTGGEIFFALATVDSDDSGGDNLVHDWGFSLVPEVYLTPLVVAGLAPGDDPDYSGSEENTAPLWVTAVFPRYSPNYDSGNTITLCIDYHGNGDVDGLTTGGTDPATGLGYDLQVTVSELEQFIVYVDLDEDGNADVGEDQTGTRIWVCDGSDALIAMAYGQDPNTASVGSPAIDIGTTVPGIPVLAIAKDAYLYDDVNGNGFGDIGDEIFYTIAVENSGTAAFPAGVVNIFDNLNPFVDYVSGSAQLTDLLGTTSLPDRGVGTIFPIDDDDGGYFYGDLLPPGGNFTLTFRATIVSLPANGTGSIINTASGTGGAQIIPVEATAPIPFPQGTVSGTVWEDTDGNGSADVGLDGVQLTLLYSDGSFVDFDAETPAIEPYTVTTFGGGLYEFPNIPAGDYLILQSQPAGYVTVTDGDTTVPGDDAPNSSTTDNRVPVSLVADETDDGNDFVERSVDTATEGSLSGTVYLDTDNDDLGDVGMGGVTLVLKDGSGNDIDSDPGTGGIQPTETTTGSDGSYSFSGLPPGNYRVVQTQPSAHLSISDTDGANNNTIGDETPIAVTAGNDSGGNDFVEEAVGSLSGFVSEDTDSDGDGDVAIAGVVLTLKDAAGSDIDSDPGTAGVQPTTTTTNGSGLYSFVDLPPGDYRVVETQPVDFQSVSDADGGDLDEIGDVSLITVAGGVNTSGNNFVEEEIPAIISGTVWADTDDNGTGDVGMAGVTLELQDELGNPVDLDYATSGIQSTVVTDSNGIYTFTNVRSGDYVIVQTQPPGYVTVSDGDTTTPGDDAANTSATDNEIPVSVVPGETDDGNDFVEGPPGSISGSVLVDLDTNGSGDVPLSGVELTLQDAAGNDIDSDPGTPGVQPTTTTTNGSGTYTFNAVAVGSYRVVQTQPVDYGSMGDADGANNNIVGDETPIVVVPGADSPGNDFVEFALKAGTYGGWVIEESPFPGGADAPGDNPDGDNNPNALEYAFCSDPDSGLPGFGEFCLMKAPDGSVQAQFMRRLTGLTDVTYTLEGADTLGTPTVWTDLASIVPVVNTTDGDVPLGAEKVLYEDIQNATELSGPTAGVVRLRVEVDADGSSTITPDEIFYTRVFGWQCVAFNDYQCATFSVPFSTKPVFSGTFATSALTISTDGSGNVTLDVTASANGVDLGTVVGAAGDCYLQVTSGAREGERFDILGGGVNAVTLMSDPDIFSESDGVTTLNTSSGLPAEPDFHGASYEVIPHRTVDEVFDRAFTFAGEEDTDPSDATRLLFHNARKDSPGFEILMLLGTSTADSKWILSNDLVFQIDQGGRRLDPCGGLWVHPKNSGNQGAPTTPAPVEVMSYGIVADHDQACAINDDYQVVGAMWPLDQSAAGLNGLDLTVASGFDGGIDPTLSTELLFWVGDFVVDDPLVTTYAEGYQNYMLLDGGGMQNWIDINDLGLTDLDSLLILQSHRAMLLKLMSGDEKEPHTYPLPSF